MLTLKARIRSVHGAKTESLRKDGKLPAVLYGPGLKKNLDLEVDAKEFIKVFQETGRTSFLQLEVENSNFLVLVNSIQKDPLTLSLSHIDFYQPAATKEIKVKVPLVFEGKAGAVKNFGGTLVKSIQEIQVQALPQNLPHEIRVDLTPLDELEKAILVKDLKIPPQVKVLKNPDEIVVQVMPPEEIEEELTKPVEEKIDQVDVIKKEKKEETPEENA